MRTVLVATVLATSVLGAPVPAKAATVQLVWTSTASPGPSARNLAAMALDRTGADVMFGGAIDGSTNGVAETWQFNGTSWSQASASPSPAARVGAAMAFDYDLQRTILFGGYAGGATNDTWAWDGVSWQQLSPAHAPPARALASMTFDQAHHQLLLFGGSTLANGSAASGLLGDTWAFDGADWQLLTTAGPSPRDWSGLAYDEFRQADVLFGGFNGSALTDTWTWDGTAWTQQTPAHSPGSRYQHALVFDRQLSGDVLLSGVDGTTGQVTAASWAWNGDWYQLADAPSAPRARTRAAADYNPYIGQLILFGGADSSGPGGHLLSDTSTAAVGIAQMAVSATTLDFGKVNLLGTADRTLTVSNSGSGFLTVTRLLLTGPDDSRFTIVGDTCTGAQLAAGTTCQVTLRYQYVAVTNCFDPCQATLTVLDGTGGGRQVALAAVETSPLPAKNPSSIDFGSVPVGTAASGDVTFANVGTGNFLLQRIYAQNPDFTVSSDCPLAPAPLPPAAACKIHVTFTPSSVGTENTQVVVLDNLPPGFEFFGVGGTGVPGPVALALPTMTGVYGGTASIGVTAATPTGTALAGLPITLTLPNGVRGQATTDASGHAAFAGVSLAGLDAGTYAGQVTAGFAGDVSHVAASVQGDLVVAPSPVTVSAPTLAPRAPSVTVQFSDTATISTSVASTADIPTGRVVFTVNGHAVAPVAVDSGGAATATIRLDQSVVTGAGTYSVNAAFTPATGNYLAAAAAGTATVAPEDAVAHYAGGYFVDSGTTPTLSATVTQADPEFVDFSAVPVWAEFDIYGASGVQSVFAQVNNAGDWAQTGRGAASVAAPVLPAGAYTVGVHLVGTATSNMPSTYVAGDDARVGVAASPVSGPYTSGGGYLAADPAATGDPAGYFAFAATSHAGQPSGSAVYSYRSSIVVGGQSRDVDVWMTSTSVTTFGSARKGAAQVGGACTLTYVDSVSGAVYGAPSACTYSITDSTATGSSPAQFSISIAATDGSQLHAASGTPAAGTIRVNL